jgi:four helix bundle protein
VKDFRRLDVWQKAHGLNVEIYKRTSGFPSEEKFGLTSQIRRCAVSIEANIAEGCGRGSDQDFRRFLQIALGSASELDCELLLARDLGFMHTEQHDTLLKELNSVRAMLATLIRKIASDDKGGRT